MFGGRAFWLMVALCCASVFVPADDNLETYYFKQPEFDVTDWGRKVSVYFNQKTYMFSRFSDGNWSWKRKGDFIGCSRFDTNADNGRLANFKRMPWVCDPSVAEDSGLSGQDVAACVYKGRIFVFYDYINPANWSERLLYYKSSVDPENSWEPKGGKRITVAEPVNTGFGIGAPSLVLTAAVLNDKLYVFYTHINWDRIGCVVYDGKVWAKGPTLSDWRFKSVDSQTILTDTQKSLIAIAGVGNYQCYVITFDGTSYYPSANYIDFYGLGLDTDYLRAAYGSVNPGSQANVLQVFGYQRPYSNGICRFEYKLPGDTAQAGTFSSKVFTRVQLDYFRGWCPAFTYLSDASRNMRQYISLVGISRNAVSIAAGTYVSDYFQFIKETSINTAEDGVLPSAWSIIGVIEGVPPFTWNKTEPDPLGSCDVKYGQSSERQVSTSSSYGGSFTVGLEGKISEVFGGGFSFTQGFKNVHDWDQTITREINITWENRGENSDGSKGYLLIEKPTLVARNYTRYASDATTLLADVNFTSVTDVNLEYEEYDLTNPPAGMKAQPKSSDYRGWYHKSPPNGNIYQKINSITASTGGGRSEASISVTTTDSVERTSTSAVKVEASFLEIFKTSSKFTFELSSKNSTTLGQSVSASLSLPAAPTGQTALVKRMSVAPYWLLPNVKSDAYWIPTDYQWNEPWCLTWSVLSLDPAPANAAAITMDFNGDNIQDVLTIAPGSIANPANGARGKVATDASAYSGGSVYLISNWKTLNQYAFTVSSESYKLLGTGEFSVDAQTGLVWFVPRHKQLAVSLSQSGVIGAARIIEGLEIDDANAFAACGDFQSGDGCDELLLRDPETGMLIVCGVDPVEFKVSGADVIYNPRDADWRYAAKGDFDGNGYWDVLVWNQADGAYRIIYLKARDAAGSIVKAVETVFDTIVAGKTAYSGKKIRFIGVCDFNGDGVSDALFVTPRGEALAVLMGASGVAASGYIQGCPKLVNLRMIAGVGDFNLDNRADLLVAQIPSRSDKQPVLTALCLESARKFTQGVSKNVLRVARRARLSMGQVYESQVEADVFKSLD